MSDPVNDPPQAASDRIDLGGGWWTQSPESIRELTRRHIDKPRPQWRWKTSLRINTDFYRTGRRK